MDDESLTSLLAFIKRENLVIGKQIEIKETDWLKEAIEKHASG
jgi:hypothetical protein